MMRGTFANIRIKNHVVPGRRRAASPRRIPRASRKAIYDAAMEYVAEGRRW